MIPVSDKQTLRQEARQRRAKLAAESPDFAKRIAKFAKELKLSKTAVIGTYIALDDEADPHLLVKALGDEDRSFCFPRVAGKDMGLTFHRGRPGDVLQPGAYGIPEPGADWPLEEPQMFLVPMLAFDASGYRLGWGGGYYDRTLAAARAKGQCLAIGVAYAGQEIEAVPRAEHDQKLDLIVTEQGVRKF